MVWPFHHAAVAAAGEDTAAQPHIVLSGGITGGHLFPGLAVAKQVRHHWPASRFTICSRGTEWERQQAQVAGYRLVAFHCSAPPRWWRDRLGWGRQLFRAWRDACRFLSRERASVVLGLGGYASLPMALAALSCRVPLVLLEQNAVAGRANRLLAPGATVVCAAFAESYADLRAAAHFVVTGTPIQPPPPPSVHASRQPLLLVLGGSHGSAELNQVVPPAISQARTALAGWQIVHQSGAGHRAEVERAYGTHRQGMRVVEFIDDLPSQLARADLVIARGGGTTLAELAAAAVPTIVCPWRQSADDHQRANARLLARAGAVCWVDFDSGSGTPAEQLSREVIRLAGDSGLRRQLAFAMLAIARPQAATHVAHCLRRFLPTGGASRHAHRRAA